VPVEILHIEAMLGARLHAHHADVLVIRHDSLVQAFERETLDFGLLMTDDHVARLTLDPDNDLLAP